MQRSNPSPFAPAVPEEKRLKCFLWGDSGVGKTTLALSFPRPVVIDMERGTDLYAGKFEFQRMRASTADEVMAAVDWLRTNKHGFATLIIDPISVYWDALQRKWIEILHRRRGDRAKGNRGEFYELQPTDWQLIKGELRALVRKLTALDMNVICTARQKALYAEGEIMKKVGETYDAEKGMNYLFDVEVRVYRDGQRHLMEFRKVRGQPLPGKAMPASYEAFAAMFGAQRLEREAVEHEPVEDDEAPQRAASEKSEQAPTTRPATAAPAARNGSAPPPANGNGHGKVISEKQLKYLWVEIRKANMDNDEVRSLLADLGLGDSTKTIPADRFEDVLTAVRALHAPAEPDGYADSLANGEVA